MTNQLIALLDGGKSVPFTTRTPDFHSSITMPGEPIQFLPLSLSMPLASAEHGHARIEAFLWDCCPTTTGFLRTGQTFSSFAEECLSTDCPCGEDCAGAVQFVRRSALKHCIGHSCQGSQMVTEDEVARGCVRCARITLHGAALKTQDSSVSLGHNPKPPFFSSANGGCPSGAFQPHIFSNLPLGMDGHAENEHFSLRLPGRRPDRSNSSVQHFGDEIAIVVERYDRAERWAMGAYPPRDMCQALGLHPTRKYESDGGQGRAQLRNY